MRTPTSVLCILLRATAALAVLGAFGPGAVRADVFIQAPPDTDGEDTDGDGIVDNDNVVLHVAAGDGFINMADGKLMYMFGFGDVTGVPEDMVMMEGMLGAEFPAPTLRFREGQRVYLNLTNVGMMMRPDLFDAHTVHYHGFPNAAAVFDGVPDAAIAINMGSTLTYFYQIVEPGTYMWHCHFEATEHMQMGMLGNQYVLPKQDRLDDGTPLNGFTHHTGYTYAYNDGDGSTYYDVDAPVQIQTMDPAFHDASLSVQPLPFAFMNDRYFMLNGRGYPDTVNPEPLANSFDGKYSQPVHTLIQCEPGDKVLLRVSNLSTTDYMTLTASGLPMRVVGGGARLFRGQDGDGEDFAYETASVTLGGGEARDVIVDTAGVEPGVYYLYSTNLNKLSNDAEDFGGAMTEIHVGDTSALTDLPIMAAPVPLGPAGTQPWTPNPLQFTWQGAANATYHEVDIWQDQIYAVDGMASWTPPAALGVGQTLWWRVRGRNSISTGPWSGWTSFNIQPLILAAPTPTAPTGNVATNPNPPEFSWTAVANALSYDVDVWQDQVYANASAGTTWTRGTAFPAGQLVWWRVRARNGANIGAWSAWASFTIQPLVIGTPTPTAPTGNVPTNPNPPQFTWTAANNAAAYDVDIWQDQVYANASAGTTWTRGTAFNAGQLIWWRVRGRNGGSVGAWSAWASFTVQPVVIGTPTPTAPTGNQPSAPNPPQFTWTAAANATAYDIDIWQDQVYASAGAGTTWTRGTAFNAGQLIWWRVRGRNGGSVGAWSAWASFTVQPVVIGTPTPTGPTGAQPAAPNPMAFTWTAANNAASYDVDVWQDQVYADVGNVTTWTRPTPFAQGPALWWRVRGRNGGSVGAWSAWQQFWVNP
jgi:FtsP/CotA-like multicopper oxidase with cupredoxin domain